MTEESIFIEALGRADRAAYLDAVCGKNLALRRRVEALLASHDDRGDFLDVPAVDKGWLRAAGPTESATVAQGDPDDGPLDFLDPSERPGSLGRLDHYEVEEVVGRGGMGVVLRAFDTKLHRVVAIKVMARGPASGAMARRRFSREAQAAAAVCHEHVVTIHAVDEDHRPPYLVMQFVEGQSLQEKLDRGGVPPLREILRIGLQTAEGLAAAHKQGLVHRDIKPANILLENGVERVKITDFGLARIADDASLTQSGVIAGTPLYMSPEQAEGEPVDARSDLFSLGSTLYATCTGRPPFRASSNLGVLRRVVEDTPRPVREINPEIPDWLADLIARLQAKAPADRPGSAAEVAAIIGDHLAELQQPTPRRTHRRAFVVRPRPRKVLPWALAALLLAMIGLVWLRATSRVDVLAIRPPIRADGPRQFAVEAPIPPIPPIPRPAPDPGDWSSFIFHLPVEDQVKAVNARLKELNPGFDGPIKTEYDQGAVSSLTFTTDLLTDISPISALRELRQIHATGSDIHKGRLNDLRPLQGLRKLTVARLENNDIRSLAPLKGLPITHLALMQNPVEDLSPLEGMPLNNLYLWATNVSDLSPIAGMALGELTLVDTPVRDISVLKGMPLALLHLSHTKIADFAPLRGLPLAKLHVEGTAITSLDVLEGMRLVEFSFRTTAIRDVSSLRVMPLENVQCDFRPERDAAVFRSIPSLKTINNRPVAEYWKAVEARRAH